MNDCSDKNYAQKSSSPQNVWNDRSALYQRHFDADRPWYEYARRLIKKSGLRGGEALDIGCGMGEFMRWLIGKGFDVKGLDGNKSQVDELVHMGLDSQIVDLEQRLPFPDLSFDLVVCLEVIEHVARAEGLMKEISRVLKPTGFLVISTPNFSCWQNRLRYLAGKGPVNEGIHLRFFTPRTLECTVKACGMKIADSASFGPVTGMNYILRRLGMKPRRWSVPRKLESTMAENLVYLVRK